VNNVVIRAGYSANAGIVLDQRMGALAVDEKLVQFDGKQAFVEIAAADGVFERKDVKLGLSDGLVIEVLDGLTLEDVVKVPSAKSD
jgi:HlyD family secretion protein